MRCPKCQELHFKSSSWFERSNLLRCSRGHGSVVKREPEVGPDPEVEIVERPPMEQLEDDGEDQED